MGVDKSGAGVMVAVDGMIIGDGLSVARISCPELQAYRESELRIKIQSLS